MKALTFTLPAAPPRDYLRAVEWWRTVVQHLHTAFAGTGRFPTRGQDPVIDLIYFEMPERIEALAREALENGIGEISPSFTLDEEVARRARDLSRRRMQTIRALAEYLPKMDETVEALHREAEARSDEVFREASTG